jgi:tetratricopeptide (TPR) repeat protein
LVQIASAFRMRRWRWIGLKGGIILAAGMMAWPMWFGQPSREVAGDYINLGNALRSAAHLSGAEKAYRLALAARDDPDAHYLLARVLLSKNKTADALRHLGSARLALPDSPDLLLTSAHAHLAARNPQQARELLHQLLDLSERSNLWPKRSEWTIAHIMLADLEPSAADKHWEQAWSIHPATAAEASFQRRKDMRRVVETFRIEAESKDWDWYAQANYGLALLETGRASQALGPLRLAIKIAPQKEGLRFHLARALAEKGMKKESLMILQQLMNELPASPLRRQVKTLQTRLKLSGD